MIRNFSYLSILKVVTLVVPLITYPYLLQVLGSKNYGLVVWVWSISNFFIVFVNFGFDLNITKYISIHKRNKTKVSEIVSTTISAKLFLFMMALLSGIRTSGSS